MPSHHNSRTARVRAILFRIFYSTSFTIVFLLTVGFACTGPIDSIYQSFRRSRLIDIFLISGVYLITGLIAAFLYASRLYTVRSLLRDIPKTYMPVDKGEVGNRRMWRLIEDCKSRSAVIAYLARPRTRRIENEVSYARERIDTLLKPEHCKEYRIFEPRWGSISHPGWSGPAAKDIPNLQYASVVAELTDLIEARAVSLAPVERVGEHLDEGETVDEVIIEALRRPEETGMRQYISQLITLDVLDDNSLVMGFLLLYDRARFAPQPLRDDEFKSLMRMFAEILRTMRSLDVSRLDFEVPCGSDDDETNLGDKAPGNAKGARPLQRHASRSTSSITSSSTSSIAGSVRHHRLETPQVNRGPSVTANGTLTTQMLPPRISHDSVRSHSSAASSAYHDADGEADRDWSWTEPTSRPPFFRGHSSNSGLSHVSQQSRSRVGQERRPRQSRLRRNIMRRPSFESYKTGGSIRSLRSARSNGSVIRLNPQYNGNGDQLPFEYISTVPGEGEPPVP